MRRTTRLSFRAAILLVSTVLTGPGLLTAQSDRGTITGAVADPAGALVPGVLLTLQNTETGAIYETKTTETGNYTLPSLPAGTYELEVTAAGFIKYIQEGIRIQVATIERIDVALKLGASSETVTVTADAPLLKTESAVQSTNMTVEQINDLPLTQGNAGLRNPIAFAQLTPSMAIPQTDTFGNIQARVNGLPDSSFRSW
jgi:hypothetical protein